MQGFAKARAGKPYFLSRRCSMIKLFKNGSPIKLYYMNDIPDFPSESSIENEIVNMTLFLYIL